MTPSFVPSGIAPFAVDRAEGAYLYTPDGRAILDAAGGAIVVNIGHGRREVALVAARELERLTYAVPPWQVESRTALIERLVDKWLPEGLTRVGFTSGGSESVDAAIRLARQHHVDAGRLGRWKVIGRDVSYHGVTLGALAAGGHARRRAGLEPLLAGFPHAPSHYCLRCPLELEYPSCGAACATDLERIIEEEGPDTVACFIAEPVVGAAGGALVPPAEYWPQIVEICRRHGVLVIADEVMCGFGRTGKRFAVEHFGVAPDILVGGKGLAGGYAPIGGIYTTEEVVAPLAEKGDVLMFYTYGAHPASCAVADKVLEIMEREKLVQRAALLGEHLSARLAKLAGHPHVGQVRGLGLLHAVEIVSDSETLEPFPSSARLANRVSAAGLERGVFLYPAGSGSPQDVILIGPPFIVEEHEIDTIVDVLEQSIDAAVARA